LILTKLRLGNDVSILVVTLENHDQGHKVDKV
jgi:hypothetical protein